jgi:hypothetical protein
VLFELRREVVAFPRVATRSRRHQACDHDALVRTTNSMPETLLRRLRVVAAEGGTSMAELIREAVEVKVAAHRPRPRCLGVGGSGDRGTAHETVDERPEPRSWR